MSLRKWLNTVAIDFIVTYFDTAGLSGCSDEGYLIFFPGGDTFHASMMHTGNLETLQWILIAGR